MSKKNDELQVKKPNAKRKIKLSKKGIAFIIIIGLVLSGVYGFQVRATKKMKERQDAAVETEAIEKRTLTNSISATGTIEAAEDEEVKTTLLNKEVTAVNVSVGDVVQVGDLLCTLDVSDIQSSLDTTQKSVEVGDKQNSISEQSAERALNYAEETKDAQVSQANTSVSNAADKLSEAQNDQTNLENDLNTAKEKVSSTKKTVDSTKKAYNSSKSEYDKNKNAYDTAKAASDAAQAKVDDLTSQVAANTDPTKLAALQTQLDTAKADLATKLQTTSDSKAALAKVEPAYNKAKAEYDGATAAYETAKANQSTVEAKLDAAKTTVKSAQTAYDSTVSERDNTTRSADNNVESQKSSLASTKLNNSNNLTSQKQQLEEYQEQLAKGNVTATIGGIVTAVNVKVGDTYTGTTMVTIEDNSAYRVTTTVDEYDISNISLGMPVIIKTNATGEEELNGKITYIAPKPETATATSATAAASGSDVSYEVRVSVDTKNDKLRLGMTAKLSIVLENKKDVYAVPYDAVTEGSDGQATIQVMKDGEKQPVTIPVQLGMETDYYMEISSDQIIDGMKVVIPSSEKSTSGFQQMRPMGGF